MPKPSADRKRSYDSDYMEEGRKAEEIVLHWCKENPDMLGVLDCRSQREGMEGDFDFSITNTDGTIILAEAKSDIWLGISGNMVFEIARVNHTAPHDRAVTLGWSARSPATWCIFYAPSTEELFLIRFEDLRRCFQQYSRQARSAVKMKWIPTDNIKSTLIALIPRKYWERFVKIYDISQR